MQRFTLADGTVVVPGVGFAFQGTRYGNNWFAELNDEQKAAIGLTPVVEDQRPDDRLYYVAEDPQNVGKWIATPRPLDQLKATFTHSVQDYVKANLATHDWMITREAEGYKTAPQPVLDYRKALRDHGNALVAEISALADFDAVTAWQMHDWPVAP